MSNASSLEDILAIARNPEYHRVAVARILFRQDMIQRHEELEEELAAAYEDDRRLNRDPVAPSLAREIEALEEEMEAVKVPFRFRQIGHRAWADLIAKHPPTKVQLRVDKNLDHNPATFPVAAIAASLIEPEGATYEMIEALEQTTNEAAWGHLWTKCLEANIGKAGAPKSTAAGVILRQSGASASTPVDEGSLAQSPSAA